ncbi:MAG TPA: hypothetical protein PK299_13010, partial [Anaerolineales bacterium]|nr:hypothetical protein [Anaerolineales bacterium]
EPQNGAVLNGIVPIRVQGALTAVTRYELEFTYAPNATDTWFLLTSGENLPADGILTLWDTTQISDGNYQLRLNVYLAGQELAQETRVGSVRVQNDSPIVPTETPAVSTPAAVTPTPPHATLPPRTANPTAPSVTRVPPQMQISPSELTQQAGSALWRGMLIALLGFGLFGLYVPLRTLIRPWWRVWWRKILLDWRKR